MKHGLLRGLLKKFMPYADVCLVPFVYPAAWLLKNIRAAGVQRLPLCRRALLRVGVFPIRNHYYEPLFDMRQMKHPFPAERDLPGINWNTQEQLGLLAQMTFSDELKDVPVEYVDDLHFHFNNESFLAGDAEYWYQIIRLKKPARIYEIGSGYSTLMAIRAVGKNKEEDSNYHCEHVCVEPYEMPWLEKTGVSVLRQKVEDMDVAFFSELEENDILFIDSSHIIRPEGDVLFEYLELIPRLNKGVIVHIHDIFSPRNYLHAWLVSDIRFWNEQYLVEAFLCHNEQWKMIGSLNFLHHAYPEALSSACPFITPQREPGSFYMQKVA